MIKIELSREGLEIDMSGIEPIVYAEAGFMLRQLYRCLRKSSGRRISEKDDPWPCGKLHPLRR